MVRRLDSVVKREGAELGVLLTLTPPTRPMVAEAAAAGQFEIEGFAPVPRLQIVTIEEALRSRDPGGAAAGAAGEPSGGRRGRRLSGRGGSMSDTISGRILRVPTGPRTRPWRSTASRGFVGWSARARRPRGCSLDRPVVIRARQPGRVRRKRPSRGLAGACGFCRGYKSASECGDVAQIRERRRRGSLAHGRAARTAAPCPRERDPGVLADLGDEGVHHRPALRLGVDRGEMRLVGRGGGPAPASCRCPPGRRRSAPRCRRAHHLGQGALNTLVSDCSCQS